MNLNFEKKKNEKDNMENLYQMRKKSEGARFEGVERRENEGSLMVRHHRLAVEK
jgi:hypothetical protein